MKKPPKGGFFRFELNALTIVDTDKRCQRR